MTLFAIYEPKFGARDAAPRAVPEKFSWTALLLPPVFFMRHGLWIELAGFIIALVGLSYAADYLGQDTVVGLYLISALWLGFAAASIRRAGLGRAGWRYRTELTAPAADTAQLVWLRLGQDRR